MAPPSKTLPPRAQRKISPLMRVMISAVLLAFAIFTVRYKKSLPQAQRAPSSTPAASNKPFPPVAPSSEVFAWIPKFPDAQLENINTKHSRDLTSYGFSFHTAQEYTQVLAFYGDRLKQEGFKVEMQLDAKQAHENGGQLHAESTDGARSFDVVAAKGASGAEIGVTAVQR